MPGLQSINYTHGITVGFRHAQKEGSSMETLDDIAEALEHASLTRIMVDEIYKKSVDDFINKLLDARLEAVK